MKKPDFIIVDTTGRKDYPDYALSKIAGLVLEIFPRTFDSTEKLVSGCQDADIILVSGAYITGEAIEAMPRLKAVIRYGTGLDRINLKAARERGVIVRGVRGFCTEEIANHALALILSFNRNILELRRDTREIFKKQRIRRLSGMNLGIIGFGDIGRSLVLRASALGFKILAYDPYITDSARKQFSSIITNLERLLEESDYVSIHCPLTEETRHLIGRKELEIMKKEAVLINTARGGIINETELITALKQGIIGGAGLDVLEEEPGVPGNPLLSMDNVILTPHVAWYSEEAVQNLVTGVFEQIADVVKELSQENAE